MSIVLDGTSGITTPDLESAGPISGTTGSFSGDVTLGSSVLATPSGSAPSYTCRAWVNFNGTGTVAIRASGNVSSITDNGTGNYTVNFTTAMPDENYVAVVSGALTIGAAVLGNAGTGRFAADTASATSVYTFNSGFAAGDAELINVAIFR